jgi:hypothetical protein
MLAVMAAWVCPCQTLAQSSKPDSGATAGGPSVFFPVKVFEFEPVIDGASVVHDFVVLNKGSAPLQINNVRTG